ncbi:phage tail tape measure protein [Variovorax ginsengisoli]|uniref:Phage tail tape measure protein n=1 Tax=Variovorax ginsengisoli TaxID=363844 RepID=A0ABT8SDQ9_9BURK|nr:phage tail tape measure protein [Variovorax ginsengisoli]MDN8617876.1 phage tail tape measure protein [Variovorax ginsengisoli]MDO1537046.1 phage tail tape measure protein [Variovorax ginsengisoli]
MTDLKKQIEVGVGATGVETGVAKAKRSLADLGATAVTEGKKAAEGLAPIGEKSQESSAKLDAATKNMIGSIQRTTAALDAGGRSGSKYFETLAAQRGINVDALKPYLAQLDAVNAKQKLAEQALNATTPALKNVGMSAAATAAAMRGVPAQFTDIVTSLQGGQAPLTVFLQQGGQLKDMFGGLAPAAKAIGGYIASLITPFTLAATAIGALAVAMYQGSQEAQAYAKALVLTGNYLGKTTDQLKEQAAVISQTVGTQGEAAEALAKLATSGKIASESLTDVGAAVVSMNRVLGTSIDEATAVFVKLGDEPAKASAKLNETMHYLNQTTYDRIRALEEQGNKEDAASLAQTTYANATTTRLKQVESQAGVLATAWRMLADDAKKAWDMMQGLGRSQTTGEALTAAQSNLAALQARGPIGGPIVGKSDFAEQMKNAQATVAELSRKALREQDAAYAEGERARTEAAKIAASDRLKTLTDEVRSNADKRKKAIADLNRDYQTLGKAASGPEYDKQVANINEKFKDPKEAKPKAFQDDAATKFLETLRQTEASLAAQLAGEEKLTDAQKKQVEFQQLIADLKDKKILTAEQKSLLASKDAISVQLAKNAGLSSQIEYEKEIEKIVKKSAEEAADFARHMEAINISMAASQTSRDDQADRSLSAFGLGDRARAEIDAQKSIRNEYQRFLTTATKQAAEKNQLGSSEYRAEVERIKEALDNALSAQTAYFDALKSKQADWKNGATTALANYSDAVDNLAAATEKTLGDGFKGAEDALVQFVTTGKGGFKSLADSIISDLARIAIQQTVTGPLAKGLLGHLGGGGSLGGGSSSGVDVLGTFISGLDKRAAGGPVSGGSTYLVGEKGPELFTPGASGAITPNSALSGGGGQPINIVINNTVGDVATLSQLREAQAGTERRIAGAIARSQKYGGALA